ncbi:MAG: hypothetical protein ACI9A1_000860, partial [Lentimonas sp.]
FALFRMSVSIGDFQTHLFSVLHASCIEYNCSLGGMASAPSAEGRNDEAPSTGER